MVKTETFELTFTTDDENIEQQLISKGINPLRWAVVSVKENKILVSVSYQS